VPVIGGADGATVGLDVPVGAVEGDDVGLDVAADGDVFGLDVD
jgi:hypothetical protein